MSDEIPDLSGDGIKVDVVSPLVILKAQAAFLSKKTQGMVRGDIIFSQTATMKGPIPTGRPAAPVWDISAPQTAAMKGPPTVQKFRLDIHAPAVGGKHTPCWWHLIRPRSCTPLWLRDFPLGVSSLTRGIRTGSSRKPRIPARPG